MIRPLHYRIGREEAPVPWIPDKNFRPIEDPHLTGQQVVHIDQTIAEYNRILHKGLELHAQQRKARGKPMDWFVVDLNKTLERLAFRRYIEDPSVPTPPDWSPYELPAAYQELNLTTQFLAAKDGRRIGGGIFSLDGIHPTTVGYDSNCNGVPLSLAFHCLCDLSVKDEILTLRGS